MKLYIVNRTVPNAYEIPSVYLVRPALIRKTTLAVGPVKR